MPHPELLMITPAISLFTIGSGIYGLLNPIKASALFGVPFVGPKETTYYRPMAAHNIATGIALGFFSRWRDERALGTLILCLGVGGLADTHILLIEKTKTQNTWLHLFNTGVAAVLGSGLLGWW